MTSTKITRTPVKTIESDGVKITLVKVFEERVGKLDLNYFTYEYNGQTTLAAVPSSLGIEKAERAALQDLSGWKQRNGVK